MLLHVFAPFWPCNIATKPRHVFVSLLLSTGCPDNHPLVLFGTNATIKEDLRLNRPQKIRHTDRKPLALGWLTRAYRSSACTIDFGRAYITPQLKVTQPCRRTDVLRRSTVGCRLIALPNQCVVTDRRASACGQATTTHAAELSNARTLR